MSLVSKDFNNEHYIFLPLMAMEGQDMDEFAIASVRISAPIDNACMHMT